MDQLGLLHSFAAVVESGSFTGAAKQLGKTKGIVSRQVNQLEALLDMRLLNRTTRAIAVTEQGREVYDRARHIIDEFESLDNIESSDQQQLSGRLRISAPQTFGEINLMAILPAFMQQHPKLHVELQLNDRYVDIVDEGFDLALRIGTLEDSNLIARKIGVLEQKLVANPDFLAQHPPITQPEDLSSLPCIYDSNRRGGTKWQLFHRKSQQEHSVKITPVFTVNSALAATTATEQGLGVSLAPAFAVAASLEKGTLQTVLAEFSCPSIGIYAIYPHRQYLAQKVKRLIDFLDNHWQLPAK